MTSIEAFPGKSGSDELLLYFKGVIVSVGAQCIIRELTEKALSPFPNAALFRQWEMCR
jgi:hypothetical protein